MVRFAKISRYPYRVMLALLGLLIGVVIYGVWWVNRFSPEEAQAMGAAHALRDALDSYAREHDAFPVELRGAQGWLADGHWPDNPYTGEPLLDTKSAEFDKETSPGNIYYQRIFSAPATEGYTEVASDRHQVSYVLHVFGANGEVWTYCSKVRLAAE